MPIRMQTLKRNDSFKLPFTVLGELAASTHPTRLAARLDPALSAATLVRLQNNQRLQPRLAKLLLDDGMDLNGSVWGSDLLHGHDPRQTAVFAGSIWHARSLLKLVSKPEVTVLIERIGAEAHTFGIRHQAQAISTSLIADPEKLARQIEHDGLACLGVWLDGHSLLDRHRVFLRLPVGTAAENPATEYRHAADQLFSLVLAHLTTEVPAI
ncbi:nodulation protein NolU [Mesorhizobium sp. LCM 4577]|uniref:nodulation protein NolU n=1 Tax=Mesorhizobium sp. LCM 4577 TaxID=1848288 RepID=UPI0008DAB598|nr:nodulation protein NolU [Mesorhizobium sp. LCM 4577]OHV60313.1 nodulation protein NolU [Mesorhizobium sp. LCM 4577]